MASMNHTPNTKDSGWSRTQMRALLRFVLRRLDEERLPQVAGSLTFTTVLALVPVLTIAFAIFTTFPLFTTFRDSLEAYFVQSLMPKGVANTILDYLSQFASKANRLSAVGAIFLIFTAITMFGTVDRTFNQIWRIQTPRPFVQRMIVYWAIMTLGPLLIGASLSFTSLLSPVNSLLHDLPILGTMLTVFISVSLTTLAFALLYLTVPHRLIDWRDAVAGGLGAAIAFEITKRLFTYFIAQFPSYRVIYGALAAVPIFLVWIYLCWLITLAGAVLAAALPVVKYERWWHHPVPGSRFLDAMAVLHVLIEAREQNAAVDALRVRAATRLGFEESESLLQQMLDAGWVGRIRAERGTTRKFGRRPRWQQDRWALLINPHKLVLADVYRLFAFSASTHSALGQQVEQIMAQGMATSVADYFALPAAKRNSVSST
jgi:membrane protein